MKIHNIAVKKKEFCRQEQSTAKMPQSLRKTLFGYSHCFYGIQAAVERFLFEKAEIVNHMSTQRLIVTNVNNERWL